MTRDKSTRDGDQAYDVLTGTLLTRSLLPYEAGNMQANETRNSRAFEFWLYIMLAETPQDWRMG